MILHRSGLAACLPCSRSHRDGTAAPEKPRTHWMSRREV